jgi:glycerol-3-phosphate acyltransferase PlsX
VEKLYLVGQKDAMERELDKQQIGRDRLVLVNATQVVDMADSGIDAVRKKKDSSMSVAAKLVREIAAQMHQNYDHP